MTDAVIVSTARTAIGRAYRGAFNATPSPTHAERLALSVGDDVRHAKYGEGVVVGLRGSGEDTEARIRFREVGEKSFILAWSPVERI